MLSPKLIASLAVVSAIVLMRHEASAESTDRNDEMRALQSADTAFTKASEERVGSAASVTSVARAAHALGVYRPRKLPLSSVARKAATSYKLSKNHPSYKYEPFGEHPLPSIPLLPDTMAKHAKPQSAGRIYHEWNNEEEMMNNIDDLIRQNFDVDDILSMMDADGLKKDTVLTGIQKWRENLSIQARDIVTQWWLEDKSLADVDALAMPHIQNPVISHSYFTYRTIFNSRSARMRKSYEEWLRDGAEPVKVRKELAERYPKEEKMTEKYCEEYEKLYKWHRSVMKIMALASYKKKWGKVSVSLPKAPIGDKTFAANMSKHYQRLYESRFVKPVPSQKLSREGKKRDGVGNALGLDDLERLELTEAKTKRKVTKWVKTGKNPDDVRTILGLNDLEGSKLTEHKKYPNYHLFLTEWDEFNTEKKFQMLLQAEMDPDKAFPFLVIHDHPDLALIHDKSSERYQQYSALWQKSHPQ